MKARHPLGTAALALALFLAGASGLRAEHPNHAQGFNPWNSFQLGDIEHVNLFNGNLSLTIPIGPSYPVGPELSYGLTLSYTGNVWEWEKETVLDSEGHLVSYFQALPRFRSNAGLGWELSLGRFQRPEDPLSTDHRPSYESPDQSLHTLYNGPLHSGAQSWLGTYFSRDGTYLRYERAEDHSELTRDRLELPDGTIQRFGTDGLPERIEDRHGNWVAIAYSNRHVASDQPRKWNITDSHGRSHTVTFEARAVTGAGNDPGDDPDPRAYRLVVTRVDLEAFGDTTATYDFSYATQSLERACNEPTFRGDTGGVTLPFLTKIELPEPTDADDRLAYTIGAAGYDIVTNTSATCDQKLLGGHLKNLTLPTGGTLDWGWQVIRFPQESGSRSPRTGSAGGGAPFRKSAGIETRSHRRRDSTELGSWSYEHALETYGETGREVESRMTVTDPLGHRSVHYFSAYSDDGDPDTTEPPGFDATEYGLPITRLGQVPDRDEADGRFLSREIFDADGNHLRSIYLRYTDSGGVYNPRVDSRRTVYEQIAGIPDGNGGTESRYSQADLFDFDGLGNYRTEVASGNFTTASDRTTITNFNPGRSVTDIPNPDEPWILDTYDRREIQEAGETFVRLFDFQDETGALRRQRILENTAGNCGANDLVIRNVRFGQNDPNGEPGFIGRIEYYGGDDASLSCGSLADLTLTDPPRQQKLRQTCGVLRSRQWLDGDGAIGPKAPDLDVDCKSGLTAVSRDSAGVATVFDYDVLGRPVSVTPGVNQAATDYTYDDGASALAPARVVVRRTSGATVLTHTEIQFDGFGRTALELRTMPEGRRAQRRTVWDAQGRRITQGEWEVEGDENRDATLIRSHDPFGRPRTITLPDGHVIDISYRGESSRVIDVPVATKVGAGGTPTLETARTREVYDRFGRLTEVREPALPDGSVTKTQYAYNGLGDLTGVTMNLGGSPEQARTFQYDGRGFLTSESHPELGAAVTYSGYDPLGNPGKIVRGDWELTYSYDPANRLRTVHALDTSDDEATKKLWKEWDYAASNFVAGTYSNGKLSRAVRHNHVKLPGTTTDIDSWVEETYTYSGVGGRLSHVRTRLAPGNAADNTRPTFDYHLEYDALGQVTRRTYPECSHKHCNSMLEAQGRDVTQAFGQGLLRSIDGFADSIRYHPNATVREVRHTNGVRWTQGLDPDDMARPSRIRTFGASVELTSGLYDYDGAGNVSRIGADRYTYDRLSRVQSVDFDAFPESCPGSFSLFGDSVPAGTSTTYESCGTITAGPDYSVSGELTLRAEGPVVLTDGFSVSSSGTLSAGGGIPVVDAPHSPVTTNQSYQYDRFGNLTGVTTDENPSDPADDQTRTLTVNEQTNRLSSGKVSYDTAGNVTQHSAAFTIWSYGRDPFDMISTATPNGGKGYTFVYGPGDERIWEVDWTTSSSPDAWQNTYTLRDLDGRLLRQFALDGENDGTGTWSLAGDFVWRGAALLAAAGLGDAPQSQIVHYHPDHLGTPRLVTDSQGNTQSQHVYFPYGQEVTNTTHDGPLEFTAHERDDLDQQGTTFDLDYMHARYYSPHLGRFLSLDQAEGLHELPQSWNGYSYVLGNPVKYTDPRGLFAVYLYETCFIRGECSNEFVDVVGEDPGYNPLTGVQGLGELIAGRFALGAGGGGLPTLGVDREEFELSFVESVLAEVPIDGGVEYARCVRENRLDYWQIIAGSAVPKRLAPPFRVPNPRQPLTTPASVAAHGVNRAFPQSTAARNLARGLRGGGRVVSRVATPLTIAEGFYDIGVLGYCGFAN